MNPTSPCVRTRSRQGFTLIELLVVIAIIAVLAVVVVLTLNPAELLRQSRDANRLSDIATITSAINVYNTDQSGAPTYSLGVASDTYLSVYDPSATSTAGDQCQGLGLPSFSTSTGQTWQCQPSSTYRVVNATGWIPVNLARISAGSPIGALPQDPTNQTSTGLFYAYNTNGTQFEVTADLESQKYKSQFATTANTNLFPEIVSGGTPTVSALYNPSGLVGYWPLNEGSGTVANDLSGDGYNGTWSGTLSGTGNTHYAGGKVGTYAGYFNGTNNYITTTNNAALYPQNGSLSVAGWVYQTGYGGSDTFFPVGNSHAYQAGNGGWSVDSEYNASGIYVSFNDQTHLVSQVALNFNSGAQPSQTLNQWMFVAVVFDRNAGLVYAYVNGVQQSATVSISSVTGDVVSSENVMLSDLAGWYMQGFMDDVRIYNRALSPAEVMALYDAEK